MAAAVSGKGGLLFCCDVSVWMVRWQMPNNMAVPVLVLPAALF